MLEAGSSKASITAVEPLEKTVGSLPIDAVAFCGQFNGRLGACDDFFRQTRWGLRCVERDFNGVVFDGAVADIALDDVSAGVSHAG